MRRAGMFGLLIAVAIAWFFVVDTGSGLDEDDRMAVTSAEQSLPPEVAETLALIETDGPFPYSRDGSVFENRERLLPQQERGYWREYTVLTPGSPDRGARRVVAGEGGELYYTDDHYGSFLLFRSAGDSS